MRVYFFYQQDGYSSFVLLHEKQLTKEELLRILEDMPNSRSGEAKDWLIKEHSFVNPNETLIDLDSNDIFIHKEKEEGDEK